MDAAELAGAIAAEQRLLEPAVRRDPEAVAELLDPGFVEIGQTGIRWTRAEILAHLMTSNDAVEPGVEAEAWTVREVGQDLALVEFETRRDGIRVRRASLWRYHGSGWRVVFHQGTRIL